MSDLQRSFVPPPRSKSRFEALFAFQCRAYHLPEPHEEYRFALALNREFRADFAWPKYQLLLEIQGGIWRAGGGAHSHPTNLERDIVKQQCAALLGFIVLPVTTDQVKRGEGIELAQRVLLARGWTAPA